jgi:pimeloyl-ACP methyl ester carboxylesterase
MMRRFSLVGLLVALSATTSAQAPGKRVAVNGMRMYYEVSGQGTPLVVLHGAYMNIPTMGAIIPRLAKTHRVCAMELQGHGRTTDIDRNGNLPATSHTAVITQVELLSALIEPFLKGVTPKGFFEKQ